MYRASRLYSAVSVITGRCPIQEAASKADEDLVLMQRQYVLMTLKQL